MGKNIRATHKLNAQTCEEQLNMFLPYLMQDLYMVHLLPCTHQDFIWLSARHFAVHAGKFLLALFIFNLSILQCCKQWQNVELIFHKSPQENVEGDQI
jgi:hypothetical protein